MHTPNTQSSKRTRATSVNFFSVDALNVLQVKARELRQLNDFVGDHFRLCPTLIVPNRLFVKTKVMNTFPCSTIDLRSEFFLIGVSLFPENMSLIGSHVCSPERSYCVPSVRCTSDLLLVRSSLAFSCSIRLRHPGKYQSM